MRAVSLAKSALSRFLRWRYGISELPERERRLTFGKNTLRITPRTVNLKSIRILEDVLRLTAERKTTYSFEICYFDEPEFFVFARDGHALQELVSRLENVYPAMRVDSAEREERTLDKYLSAGYLMLRGNPVFLKTAENFGYDPLKHLLGSMTCKSAVQFLFRSTKYAAIDVEGKSFTVPLFECRVIALASSNDWREARKCCESVLKSFAVFDDYPAAMFYPKMVSFPIFRSSKSLLKKFSRRKFSLLFEKKFHVTNRTLAAMAHFPKVEK